MSEKGTLSFICTEHMWSSSVAGCPACWKEKKVPDLLEKLKSGKIIVALDAVNKTPQSGR